MRERQREREREREKGCKREICRTACDHAESYSNYSHIQELQSTVQLR